MRAFLKKDMLVFWRGRKELLIQLILPILLIIVLGLVLPGWIENPASTLHVKAAYVVNDDEDMGVKQFQASLKDRGIPEVEVSNLIMLAEQSHPSKLLREVFANEQVAEMVELVELEEEEALRRLNEGEIQAIVTLPEGFTLHVLNKMLLNEGEGTSISLIANDPSIEISVLQGVIDSFAKQFNMNMAIGHAWTDRTNVDKPVENIAAVGGLERIDEVRVVTSFQYFTLAIGVLFAMYVSTAAASKVIAEKREQVFQRILLSGSRPLTYLAGKLGSTLIMSMIQMSLIIIICHFALQLFPGFSLKFWIGFILQIIVICLFIAALSGLFTAAMYRMNPDTANAIIHSLLIAIGVVGGNFVPVYILPDSVQQLWEWTPNGLWLSTMIQWIQQESWAVAGKGMLGLLAFTLAIAALSVWIFPKRRQM